MRMRLIAIMGIATMITGTPTEVSTTTLSDYYIKLLNSPSRNLSTEYVELTRDALSEFEYKKELHEIDHDSSKEEIKQLGFIDLSDNIFTNGNERLNIHVDETHKEVLGIAYIKDNEDLRTDILCTTSSSKLIFSGDDINKQKEVLDRLNLDDDLSYILNSYFNMIDDLRNKKEIKIDDFKSIFSYNSEEVEDVCIINNDKRYTFLIDDVGTNIEVSTRHNVITDVDLYVDLNKEANYELNLESTNNSIFNNGSCLKLETSIISDLHTATENEGLSEHIRRKKLSNTDLYNFIFNDEELEFYSTNIN